MGGKDTVREIQQALRAVARGLEELESAGGGIPAVEKNVVRLRGTLRALETQFVDLVGATPDPSACGRP